jgi:hypothetical protein
MDREEIIGRGHSDFHTGVSRKAIDGFLTAYERNLWVAGWCLAKAEQQEKIIELGRKQLTVIAIRREIEDVSVNVPTQTEIRRILVKYFPHYQRKPPNSYPGRNKEIYIDRIEKGMTYRAIGEKYNLSRERIRQIVAKIERQKVSGLRIVRRKHSPSRPIDMGGPRDVWITEDLIDAQ